MNGIGVFFIKPFINTIYAEHNAVSVLSLSMLKKVCWHRYVSYVSLCMTLPKVAPLAPLHGAVHAERRGPLQFMEGCVVKPAEKALPPP